jgi:hypothetical protein
MTAVLAHQNRAVARAVQGGPVRRRTRFDYQKLFTGGERKVPK